MFDTKFRSPGPIFYMSSLKCTRTGEQASIRMTHLKQESQFYHCQTINHYENAKFWQFPKASDVTLYTGSNIIDSGDGLAQGMWQDIT